MANNYLEQLVAEWYEYQGYFVRRNVLVGKRAKGGYKCELDVVGLHPSKQHLVHIEPSMDCHKWEKREQRFAKKFKIGTKVVRHAKYVTFQLAEVAVPRRLFAAILERIRRLRAAPCMAPS